MPELPDISLYLEHIRKRIVSRRIEKIRIFSPFLVRTFDPAISDATSKRVENLRRIGKQIVFGLEGDLFIVIHLMIAGRFQWKPPGAKGGGKIGLAAFDFENGTLLLTEASSKKRASLHVVRGEASLVAFNKGGIEVMDATPEDFRMALERENHTLKRALTDPRLFSGIGNAYSDEILHRAGLSPMKLTKKLTREEILGLHTAVREVLGEWIERLRTQAGEKFPEKVTAFRPEMAVHGKYREPCPVCGTRIQRISYTDNECNYCPRCQTGGKILADRSLSRILKDDWPESIDELEANPALTPQTKSVAPRPVRSRGRSRGLRRCGASRRRRREHR